MKRSAAYLALVASLAACTGPASPPSAAPPSTHPRTTAQEGAAATPSSSLPAASTPRSSLLAEAVASRKDVKWDPSTLVTADLDGDGKSDSALVGYVGDQLLVVIGNGGRAQNTPIQLMQFAIGQTQDSICAAPATLEVTELSCGTGANQLPGCIGAPAPALKLSGGDCDPIYLYWDHDHKRMGWWRN